MKGYERILMKKTNKQGNVYKWRLRCHHEQLMLKQKEKLSWFASLGLYIHGRNLFQAKFLCLLLLLYIGAWVMLHLVKTSWKGWLFKGGKCNMAATKARVPCLSYIRVNGSVVVLTCWQEIRRAVAIFKSIKNMIMLEH